MELLGYHKSLVQERPHILISWLSMVALEDIPEFVTLTKITPEYVIQSLLYRLRQFEQMLDNNTTPKVLEVTIQVQNITVAKFLLSISLIHSVTCVFYLLVCFVCAHSGD